MAEKASQRVLRPAATRLRKSKYVAALDGLRAFAVLAVIFYHMGLDWAPGGLMGVTVFFVISGYLINGLLVAEFEAHGTISLSQFWLRRVRRIVPAVLLALAGTLVICAVAGSALFDKARTDLLPSLLFFNNWWQIFHNVSYFQAAASPSPLTHYWSLAIEEQFYIVWPLLVLLLMKVRMPKPALAAVVGLLAALSFGEMAFLYSPGVDPSRIYYGTDTRAGSLLVGVLLAFVWPSTIFGHRRAQSQSSAVRTAFNVMGVVCLVGLVAIIGFSSSYTPFPYYGGIALVSVLTAGLIAVLVVPNTWVERLLQARPLVWIGKRSYGMYLWHYPILLATSKFTSTFDAPWWVFIAQVIVIFAVSDVSYRFVEMPIRQGALRTWWQRRRGTVDDAASSRRTSSRASSYATAAVCGVLACTAAATLVFMPVSSRVSANGVRTSAQAERASQTAASAAAVASAGGQQGSNAPGASGSSEGQENAADASGAARASDASSQASATAASASAAASSAAANSAASSQAASSAAASAASSAASSGASSAAPSASAASAASNSSASAASQVSASAASAASSASSADATAEGGIFATVQSTLQTRIANLTEDEVKKARDVLEKSGNDAAETIDEAVKETAAEVKQQNLDATYAELFETKHLSDMGGIVYSPLLIGDSVAGGCENEFYRVFPYGHSDAEVNRSIWESPYLFYDENGQVGDYVIFCLGTNDPVVDSQMDDLLNSVGADKKIILVNIRCPRDWETQTNKAIADAAKRHENVVALADWYAASAGHDEYFNPDGIHVNEVGAQAYIALLRQTIMDTLK